MAELLKQKNRERIRLWAKGQRVMVLFGTLSG
jgi:hypothetical protein